MLRGLCDTCVHQWTCFLMLSVVGLDHNNTFTCVADVTHCKQYKKDITIVK